MSRRFGRSWGICSSGSHSVGGSGGICSSGSRCRGGGLFEEGDSFRALCTIDISIEDTPSVSSDVNTPVNACITGDDGMFDRSETMSGVVDLDPWKRFSRGIPLNS